MKNRPSCHKEHLGSTPFFPRFVTEKPSAGQGGVPYLCRVPCKDMLQAVRSDQRRLCGREGEGVRAARKGDSALHGTERTNNLFTFAPFTAMNWTLALGPTLRTPR